MEKEKLLVWGSGYNVGQRRINCWFWNRVVTYAGEGYATGFGIRGYYELEKDMHGVINIGWRWM